MDRILGAVSGYYGGWVDSVIMRFVDIMLCFPTFFLILAVIAFLEPSIWNIMIIIGLTSWMGVTRLVRADFITLRERDFVEGRQSDRGKRHADYFSSYTSEFHGVDFSRGYIRYCRGDTHRIGLEFFRHWRAAAHAQLGQYSDRRQRHIDIAWWLSLYPGLAILITVVGYNLLGEGIRDLLDPRLKK